MVKTTDVWVFKFAEDLRCALIALLNAAGETVPAGEDYDDVLCRYFNRQHRRIQPKPRAVEWSAELQARTDLPTDERGALTAIETESVAGHDLNPRQGTSLSDGSVPDPLLNDWGVHHLHFGLTTGKTPIKPGFVNRSGPVLFVFVADATLYFLDVLHHGKGHKPWSKKHLVEVLHKNWPAVIARHKVMDIVPVSPREPTEAEYQSSRDSGVSMWITMSDGTRYWLMGGGYMSNGLSARVRHEANNLRAEIKRVGRLCETEYLTLLQIVREKSGQDLTELKLRFSVNEDEHGMLDLAIVEDQTCAVLVGRD